MSTLEQRMQGGSSIPWIPQLDKAAKFRAEGKDCNSDELLIGKVVDHFTRDNFNGDGKIDVVVLELDNGERVAVHCSATVLAGQMRDASPSFMDRIGVKYLGVVSRQGQADYHGFLVNTDRSKGGRIHWAGEPDPVADYVEPAPVRHEYQAPADTAGGNAVDESDIPF